MMWTVKGTMGSRQVQVQIEAPTHREAARKAAARLIVAHSIVLNTDAVSDRAMAIAAAKAMGEAKPITQDWRPADA